jgi:RNA polymerase sigma-70 factor (ECF subfamily)
VKKARHEESAAGPQFTFTTTHWSVVLAAGQEDAPQARAALEELCRTYWYPLYAYVRRQGRGIEDAQDLTQEFFVRLLEKHYLGLADPTLGRFRTFLLSSLKHFLINDWKKSQRQKRGGGQAVFSFDEQLAEERYAAEPKDELSPERIFEKRWALTLIERALARLGLEYAGSGQEQLFNVLREYVWGLAEPESYSTVARRLQLSEGAVRVAVHRLRRRCRDLIRSEIAQTVAVADEIDAEVQHLMGVLAQ